MIPLKATTRSCYIMLSNESGVDINMACLTHTSGKHNTSINQAEMA